MVQGKVAIVESMKEEEKSRRKRSVGHCAIQLRNAVTFSVQFSRVKTYFMRCSITIRPREASGPNFVHFFGRYRYFESF